MDEKLPRVAASVPRFKGRVFAVRTDTLEADGKRYDMDIVEHAGSFAIAAMPAPGRLLLVGQYRHAAGRILWEIPAGKAEGGESCEDGALRELEEETGFKAGRLEKLCTIHPTPGFCTEVLHIFAAYDLSPGRQQFDEDEQIELREVSFEEAWSMQASGSAGDAKTMLALLWLSDGQVKKLI